ncbi:MAG TPA: hypothetical protein ENJ19_01565 [Gammaproteobacteria bacterium]|nr:hypothetical protein [Gammaproteobacteria bacterium]
MRDRRTIKTTGVALWVVLLVAGCSLSGTSVNVRHHLVSGPAAPAVATVYFLRPQTERAMGFSDNALKIAVDGDHLLDLAKGDYTLIYMHPRVEVSVELENKTEVGPFWKTAVMKKRYPFTFEGGGTYFIVVEPINGEFRGVFFKARSVDRFTAKTLAENMRASGVPHNALLSTL